jgi:glycosyltransferase involved in cell wall biosynthesis/GT2 family glycosyltransferase
MRICLVSREFAPYFGAGIGTYASQMARAWAAAGHEVHVLTAPHAGLPAEPTFHTVNVDRGRAALDAYRFDFLRHAMAVYESLRVLHADHPFDVIELPEYWAEGYFVLRAKRTRGEFAGAVLSVRLHTPTALCRELNREDWLDEEIATLEHAEESCIREADVLLSPTRSLLDRVVASARLPDSLPRAVVPYPFDPASIAELGRSEPAGEHPPPTILYFGRLEHRKGVRILIDAAQRLLRSGLDFRVRFIGADTATGPHGHSYSHWLRRAITPEHLARFAFEPARPRAALGKAIRAATLCCFPSLWENFPNACLEAMSLGAPVVGSDAGGMAEIIEDGRNGLLFRAGDAASLADTLRRALTDAPLRARLSASAPLRASELCNPGTVVQSWESTVDDARRAPRTPVFTSRIRHPTSDISRVSVIIPFYNLGPFLPRTLESLRSQTFRDFETIVIDDGSTDPAALALLAEIDSGAHGPVRVLRQPNSGLSAARNAGLAAALARWVVPLDADDTLEPSFLESCLAAAAADPGLTFVTSLVRYFYDTPDEPHGGWVPLGIDRDLLAFTNCAATCTALIDRQAVLDAGGYDPWLTSYEDWDLWCRLAARGARGTVIPEFLIHYRCRPDSMVRTEGKARRDLIHACLIARHAALPEHPDRTMRLHLARAASGDAARDHAERIISENIRYRVVDRLNNAFKATGLHRAAKGLAVLLGADGTGSSGDGAAGSSRDGAATSPQNLSSPTLSSPEGRASVARGAAPSRSDKPAPGKH